MSHYQPPHIGQSSLMYFFHPKVLQLTSSDKLIKLVIAYQYCNFHRQIRIFPATFAWIGRFTSQDFVEAVWQPVGEWKQQLHSAMCLLSSAYSKYASCFLLCSLWWVWVDVICSWKDLIMGCLIAAVKETHSPDDISASFHSQPEGQQGFVRGKCTHGCFPADRCCQMTCIYCFWCWILVRYCFIAVWMVHYQW